VTETVTDSLPPDNEQQPQPKTSVANDPLKRFRKGRPITAAEMEERVNTAYMMMLSGGTRRENAAQLAAKYGVSHRQAENYIHDAQQLMKADYAGKREELLNQVNNMRMHTVRKALKRGNYQVVAHLLDSIARGAGEGTVEQSATQAPTLNITIDDKRHS
jgi:hypothetical protein